MTHRRKRIYYVLGLLLAGAMALPAQEGQLPDAVKFKTLVNFDGADGSGQYSFPPVQGTDGNLFGTAFVGGANSDGTFFKMTPAGKLTTLYNFCAQPNCADGAGAGGLVLGTDGNF